MKNSDLPAYPLDSTAESDIGQGYNYECSGLSKREAFAIAALHGLLAADPKAAWSTKALSAQAVQQADALLAALEVSQ